MKSNRYDVIIIGAGIGGLICGCYLAKAGMKILIVEKNDEPGGCARSLKLNNFTFDMGAHLIGGCGSEGLFTYYLKKLKLNIDFIKLDPFDRFIFNKETIEIPDQQNKYIFHLQEMFPRERKNITSFFNELTKIYKSYLIDTDYLKKYLNSTYQEFLDNYIKDKKLQGILSGQCPYVGLPPKKASIIAMSFMMVSYLQGGMYYTKGGTQKLADSLCKKITEYSGAILYTTKIKKIKIKRNAITGVVTDKGDFIKSKIVVSNIDAEKTFFDMIGDNKLENSFVKKLHKMKKSISLLQLHMGVDIDSKYLEKISGWYYPDYNINNSFTDMFYIFVPTLFDNSLAPDKKNIIQILKFFPNNVKKIKNWESIKRNVEESFLEKIEELIRINLRQRIIKRIISTPKDIEEFTGNSCGSVYGWEMSPKYIMNNRIDNTTPIRNLFLTGHWTNPGCGILGVATSGIKTGKEIISSLNE